MIEEDFNSRTLANMTIALDRVCKSLPDGEHHPVRAHVAEAILNCARGGGLTLKELEAAGRSACCAPAVSSQGKRRS